MKYRIIGDIHGRHNWHPLIEPFDQNTTYIFVGDYTDPYYYYEKGVDYQGMLSEFECVLNFKRAHKDNVILLYGNHDMQYLIGHGDTNRFDREHYDEIHEIFESNKELFHGIAYHVGEKYLITHAGVTGDWFFKYFGKYEKETMGLEDICNKVNKLWEDDKKSFTFSKNATKLSDYYGSGSMHSPVWIRPESLWEHNIFGFESGVIQIVGHTAYESIQTNDDAEGRIATYGTSKRKLTIDEIEMGPDYWIMDDSDNTCSLVCNEDEHVDIILDDCLRKECACVEIDEDTLEWKKITI